MTDNKRWAPVAIAGGLLFAAGVLVWPEYREVHQIRTRLDDLDYKVSALPELTAEVGQLVSEVESVHAQMDRDMREIPQNAEVASLMRRLSIPVDGVNITDQTFSASSRTNATDESSPMLAVPVTVEMQANFSTVFSLLRSAESMARLIRVSSVRLARDHQNLDTGSQPFLAATVGLDAIFEPVEGSQER